MTFLEWVKWARVDKNYDNRVVIWLLMILNGLAATGGYISDGISVISVLNTLVALGFMWFLWPSITGNMVSINKESDDTTRNT